MARRKRLSAEDAKARILDAAVERLRDHGPRALKLTALAKDLGTSHQAILHHFGSRDELVVEVVGRALDELQAEMLGAIAGLDAIERLPGQLLEKAFEVLVDQGHGRLFAWLALENPEAESRLEERQVLDRLADQIGERREAGGDPREPREIRFVLILMTYALLGSSVFSKGAFRAAGFGDDPEAKADFRRWLIEFVIAHLGRP